MLTASEKTAYREELFRHLDGIAVAPVAYALKEKGILDFLLKKDSYNLTEITKAFDTNEGYLNVALRILASQGWLIYEVDNTSAVVTIRKNEQSEVAFHRAELYKDVVEFMKISEE